MKVLTSTAPSQPSMQTVVTPASKFQRGGSKGLWNSYPSLKRPAGLDWSSSFKRKGAGVHQTSYSGRWCIPQCAQDELVKPTLNVEM